MKFLTSKFYWLFTCLLFWVLPLMAQRKSKVTKGFTETQLINRIHSCIVDENAYCYLSLFPDMDTLSKIVMSFANPSSRDYRDMAVLQRDPVRIMHADSIFQNRLKQGFEAMIEQGKGMGIHWHSVVPVRYELVKAFETKSEVYEKLAPVRFTGYVFIMDALTRKMYGFTISEMLQINNEWYGGYIGEVYEALNKDEYEEMKIAARRDQNKPRDTTARNGELDDEDDNEEDPHAIQKMIVERKYYTGKLDDEIPIQLYIRGLKGTCKETICFWEAIYKFGDQDEYIMLKVSRTEDGKWLFVEDPPAGSMELTLENGIYTGTWTANDNQTGYEVKLKESPATPKKRDNLEAAFLSLRSGSKK
jgi:hypothetical protein